jgi:tRNA(adenine34) deaminase
MKKEDKMAVALDEAKKALVKGELPIGAAAFLGNYLLYSCHTSEIEDKRLLVHGELKVLQEIDKMGIPFQRRNQIELFTTLEPCMMCLGAAVSSFIGKIFFGLSSRSDGAAIWAERTWKKYHIESSFQLPKIEKGIYEAESLELFCKYIEKHKTGPMVDWARTLIPKKKTKRYG